MVMTASLKYKLLQLVLVQAAFFTLSLACAWLINPSWLDYKHDVTPQNQALIKSFKHSYSMLNTLSIKLANTRDPVLHPSERVQSFISDLDKQTTEFKNISKRAQLEQSSSRSMVDFSVLVSYIFKFQHKLRHLTPGTDTYPEQLWQLQMHFTRIQSESFYIIEEVERNSAQAMRTSLDSTRKTLFIWMFVSLATLALSLFLALRHAERWKLHIAGVLEQAYRLSAGDYQGAQDNTNTSNGELSFLAQKLKETAEKLKPLD